MWLEASWPKSYPDTKKPQVAIPRQFLAWLVLLTGSGKQTGCPQRKAWGWVCSSSTSWVIAQSSLILIEEHAAEKRCWFCLFQGPGKKHANDSCFTWRSSWDFTKKICALFISGSEDLHALFNDLGLQQWVMLPSPQLSAHAKLKHFWGSLEPTDESQCAGKKK